jgi:hypothetical protein
MGIFEDQRSNTRVINYAAWNVNFLSSRFLEIRFNTDGNQFNLRVAAASNDLRVGWARGAH